MAILTLTQYKSYKGVTSTTDDTQRTNIINAVLSQVISYCNRTFDAYASSPKTEYFDASYSSVYPSEYPLGTITSVKTSADAGKTYDVTLEEYTDYIIDSDNSRIVALGDTFVSTNYPINAIEVIYTGGYITVPEDLTLATINLVDYYLDEDYTPSKAFAGVRVENIVGLDNSKIPPHIRRVLEHYRSANL